MLGDLLTSYIRTFPMDLLGLLRVKYIDFVFTIDTIYDDIRKCVKHNEAFFANTFVNFKKGEHFDPQYTGKQRVTLRASRPLRRKKNEPSWKAIRCHKLGQYIKFGTSSRRCWNARRRRQGCLFFFRHATDLGDFMLKVNNGKIAEEQCTLYFQAMATLCSQPLYNHNTDVRNFLHFKTYHS